MIGYFKKCYIWSWLFSSFLSYFQPNSGASLIYFLQTNVKIPILDIFQAVDILRMDYEPSDLDILYAEGVTSSNGLACVDFSFPQSSSDDMSDSGDQHDSLTR